MTVSEGDQMALVNRRSNGYYTDGNAARNISAAPEAEFPVIEKEEKENPTDGHFEEQTRRILCIFLSVSQRQRYCSSVAFSICR